MQEKNIRVKELEDKLKKELESCNNKLSNLKNSNEDEIKNYKEKILDLESKLNSELNKQKESEAEHKAELQRLQVESKRVEDEYKKLLAKKENLQKEYEAKYQEHIKQLELESQKAKEENKKLLEANSSLQKDYDSKIATLMSSSKKVEPSSKESSKIVSDYTINVEKDREKNLILDGYVNSSAEHEKIIQEANRLFGEKKVIDKIKILKGAPEKWSDTLILSLNNLYKLDYGEFSLINDKIEFKGYTVDKDTKDSVTDNISKYLYSQYSYKIDINILEKEPKKEIVVEYSMVDRLRKRNVKGSQKRIKSKRSLMRAENRDIEKNEKEPNNKKLKVKYETQKESKDNLQLIRGIGKVLEKTLNSMGIYRFEQIASWSDKEAEQIGRDLDFPGRIEREEWIVQAKKLAKGEKTEFSERVKRGEVPTSKDK